MIPEIIIQMQKAGLLRDLDVYTTESLLRRHNSAITDNGWLLLALTSRALEDGHVCLDIGNLTTDWILRRNSKAEMSTPPASVITAAGNLTGALQSGDATELAGWPEIIGDGNGPQPFVWNPPRIYLRRYWEYEQTVARILKAMARAPDGKAATIPSLKNLENLEKRLRETFDNPEQLTAARMALSRRLTIITGGPGTGKTYTAARILALLNNIRMPGNRQLRVRLAAPTGKAAAKMDEGLRDAMQGIDNAPNSRQAPDAFAIEPAATIERLLGFIPGSPYFRHNAQNPIPADMVLIDEASMIDLAKTAKLLDALAPNTSLILLGDMHQLSSVQPGSVLGEICAAETMQNCVIRLTRSIRFGTDTPIGRLSAAVRNADTREQAETAWNMIHQDGLRIQPVPDTLTDNSDAVNEDFARGILTGFKEFLEADTPERIFAALGKFRVLCALRHGPLGALYINRIITDILALRGIRPDIIPAEFNVKNRLHPTGEFHEKRVVMVTENDYAMRLFNGDVGVILPDPENGGILTAFFEQSKRSNQNAAATSPYRKISCTRLPQHETAFAMTIHKAQGSEFDKVLALMPNRDNPVLTRELLYTAITRAANDIELWCNAHIFKAMTTRGTRRSSGLRTALQNW